MSNNGSGKQKDWVLFPYDANNEKAIKTDICRAPAGALQIS